MGKHIACKGGALCDLTGGGTATDLLLTAVTGVPGIGTLGAAWRSERSIHLRLISCRVIGDLINSLAGHSLSSSLLGLPDSGYEQLRSP